jgi:hypothetical protein
VGTMESMEIKEVEIKIHITLPIKKKEKYFLIRNSKKLWMK